MKPSLLWRWRMSAVFCVLIAGSISALAQKFELRRVVNAPTEKSEILPWLKPPAGGEMKLRVEKESLLGGRHIQSAAIEKDPISGKDQVKVTLTPEGRDLFAKATSGNVGKKLAVVIDGKVALAPMINEPIRGGVFVISGNFNGDEVKAIAKALAPGK
jgi:preprotein translocase subunit SecD